MNRNNENNNMVVAVLTTQNRFGSLRMKYRHQLINYMLMCVWWWWCWWGGTFYGHIQILQNFASRCEEEKKKSGKQPIRLLINTIKHSVLRNNAVLKSEWGFIGLFLLLKSLKCKYYRSVLHQNPCMNELRHNVLYQTFKKNIKHTVSL